jgi:hypothetical protein
MMVTRRFHPWLQMRSPRWQGAFRSRFIYPMTLLLIFLLPVPLGSNRIWAWAMEGVLAVGLLLLFVLTCDESCWRQARRQLRAIAPALWVILAWLLWNLLFVLPLPADWVKYLAPAVSEKAISSGVQPGGLSLDRYASWVYFLQSLFYTAVFLLVFLQVNSSGRLRALWWTVFLAAVFQSLYGLWLVSVGSRGLVYGFYDVSAGSLAGSFVNRNHAVAFLSLGLLAGLALRWGGRERGRQDFSGHSLHRQDSLVVRGLRFLSSPRRLLDVLLLIVVAAIASTHSRAGVLNALIAGMVFILLVQVGAGRVSATAGGLTGKNRGIKKWLLAGLVVTAVTLFAGAELAKTAQRWATTADSPTTDIGGERWLALEQGWQHGLDYWPWGTGGGSYQSFFVLHRSAEQTHYFDHAHNDYLEFLIENGLGAVFVLVLIIWLVNRAWQARNQSHTVLSRPAAALVIAVIVYFLVHGLVDFNARIPANVLVALALAAGFLGLDSAMSNAETRKTLGGTKNVKN